MIDFGDSWAKALALLFTRYEVSFLSVSRLLASSVNLVFEERGKQLLAVREEAGLGE